MQYEYCPFLSLPLYLFNKRTSGVADCSLLSLLSSLFELNWATAVRVVLHKFRNNKSQGTVLYSTVLQFHRITLARQN